ncbi:MAG TPA: tetratricopeptide repeat protein [Bacteroidales bacterium]|nr:tetratricopeptide repeat protein [Bacteroidales bacterium]
MKSIRKIHIIALIGFTLLFMHALAQEDTNLIKERIENSSGTEKVDLLLELSDAFKFNDWEKSLNAAQDALFHANKINDTSRIAKACSKIGNIYYYTYKYEKASEFYHKSHEAYKSINDLRGNANLYHNIGMLHQAKNKYDSALIFYQKSLTIEEQLNNIEGAAESMSNIGSVYQLKGDYDSAILMHEKSLEKYKAVGNDQKIILTYLYISDLCMRNGYFEESFKYLNQALNLAEQNNDLSQKSTALNLMAQGHYEMQNFSFAEKLLNQSLLLRNKLGDKEGESILLNNLGWLSMEINNYEKADQYYRRALEIQKVSDDKRVISNIYTNLGMNLLRQGKAKESIAYFNTAIDIAKKIKVKPETRRAYEQLIIAYAQLQEYEKSKKYMEAYSAIDDSARLKNIEEELESLLQEDDEPVDFGYSYYLLAGMLFILVIIIMIIVSRKR